ncbi:MAG: hypothetical protein ACRCYU_17660 [Nocardioides sp.]
MNTWVRRLKAIFTTSRTNETLTDGRSRTVTLRSVDVDGGHRALWAYVDAQGALHIDGQDLGAGTEIVSPDGEYEWFKTYSATDVPAIITLLDGEDSHDVIDLLEQRWVGEQRSYELERRLSGCGIPFSFYSC